MKVKHSIKQTISTTPEGSSTESISRYLAGLASIKEADETLEKWKKEHEGYLLKFVSIGSASNAEDGYFLDVDFVKEPEKKDNG